MSNSLGERRGPFHCRIPGPLDSNIRPRRLMTGSRMPLFIKNGSVHARSSPKVVVKETKCQP